MRYSYSEELDSWREEWPRKTLGYYIKLQTPCNQVPCVCHVDFVLLLYNSELFWPEIATQFEVSETVCHKWSKGVSRPHPVIKGEVIAFITWCEKQKTKKLLKELTELSEEIRYVL